MKSKLAVLVMALGMFGCEKVTLKPLVIDPTETELEDYAHSKHLSWQFSVASDTVAGRLYCICLDDPKILKAHCQCKDNARDALNAARLEFERSEAAP